MVSFTCIDVSLYTTKKNEGMKFNNHVIPSDFNVRLPFGSNFHSQLTTSFGFSWTQNATNMLSLMQ